MSLKALTFKKSHYIYKLNNDTPKRVIHGFKDKSHYDKSNLLFYYKIIEFFFQEKNYLINSTKDFEHIELKN